MIPLTLFSALPAAQVADTVMSVPVRDSFDMIFGITAGVISITLLGFLAVLVFLILQARHLNRILQEFAGRIATDRGVEHLRGAAGNLEQVSRTLADEAEVIRGSGQELAARIERIADRMEDRIEEFNALMEVIQLEAEDAFVDTASTARGVRRGIGHLGSATRNRGRRGSRARDRERPLPPPTPGFSPGESPGPSGAGPAVPGARQADQPAVEEE